GRYGLSVCPSKANCRTRVPGTWNSSRRARTSGVIEPRSSAMNGRPPKSLFTVLKKSAPGPGTHCPDCAVAAPAGTCHAAANPRKWSRRITSTMGEQSMHAIDAPAIASLSQRLPVVDGVAPELSVGAEVIGRYTSYELWLVLLVQQKYLWFSPDV